MTKLAVHDWSKKIVGELELNPEVFSVEVKKGIIYDVIKWYQASSRQGTAMVKTRSLVSGGGKKPFKQKGTGNARQGTSRSPLMPGGAKLFGPVPRGYGYSLPKKVRRLGVKMALSLLNSQGKILAISTLDSSDGKTKALNIKLSSLGVQKAVMVDVKKNEFFCRASNNLKDFKYVSVDGVNVFDLLKYGTMILTPEAVKVLNERS